MDKVKKDKENRFTVRNLLPRFFKALFKTAVICVLFFVFSKLVAPLNDLFGYQSLFTTIIVLYLFFVFAVEFTRGTIFQHVFSIANALMIVLYFAYALNTSEINFVIEQVNLMVDLRFFFSLFVLGGMLGFAKNMLQLLSWVNEKEERWLKYQIKSL